MEDEASHPADDSRRIARRRVRGRRNCGSGDEALAVVDESGTTVHLAFVDVRLPGTMDGIALVSRLRETHPGIKLAVVSAYPPDWPSPRLVEVFIGKPYDVSRTVSRQSPSG